MSLEWPSDRVRSTFVDFFVQKCGHVHVPSSPVFPYDDPTLLFTNAGMNQFKPIFLGTVDPKSEQAKLTRAANSQKCIRAGGKDTYHHTFFEMLGNWSFGDYFQKEAISWAWELLTTVYGLDPNRIYATYFKGDEADGLPADTKAKELWESFLPPERVLPFGRKENFWEMGETGPCGPCSEIHYDRVGGRDASQWVNADSPEVIEIWNLVFMAFNREESGKLTPLPARHVDTGMGFERLTSILQNVKSNYDSDVFTPIFQRIHEITKATPYSGRLGEEDVDNRDTAYRIVADHIRTLTIALADGAQPSDSGRGYVLRRILRRAVRAGKSFLNAPDGFFQQLVDVVVEKLGPIFPELVANKEHVVAVIKHEEALFIRTLDRGLRRFESLTRNLKKGDSLSGSDAFLLYGTYGFPLDLIQVMCAERGLTVDLAGFNEKLQRTRENSQKAYAAKKGETKFALSAAAIAQLQKKGVATTDDVAKYGLEDIEAKVVAIWQGTPENGSFVDSVEAGKECGVVLDRTNFYAEGGGQIYDCGFLTSDTLRFDVTDAQVFGGYVVHIGSVVSGAVKVDESVTCTVNNERRSPIMSNHTATHMVNLALRTIVNPKTEQRGSVVSDERFRFDFDHASALGREQLQTVDEHVNEIIKKALPVYTREIALEEAKLIRGVRAMFGEAYPNPVRVVSVGADLDQVLLDMDNEKWGQFSIEFCGGTHLSNTSEAQLFTIVSEEPVSMGVRRLVVVTGDAARAAYTEADRLEKAVAALENVSDDRLGAAVTSVQTSIDAAVLPAWRKIDIRASLQPFQEKVKKLQKNKVAQDKASGNEELTKAVEALKESNAAFYVTSVNVGSNNRILSDSIVELVDAAKRELNREVAVMLFSADAKKAIVAANVPASLIAKGLKANEWVAHAAKVLGGKGGGSPKGDVAQGNGADIAKVPEAVEAGKSFAQTKLA